jgi:hypothetical protein
VSGKGKFTSGWKIKRHIKEVSWVCWVWWHMTIIPATGMLRQQDHEFEANLSHKVSSRPVSIT